MNNKVFIRVDGNSSVGMGHLIRCLALANMINSNFRCIFVIQEPLDEHRKLVAQSGSSVISLKFSIDYKQDCFNLMKFLSKNDIVVLDGYNFDTDYQKRIKQIGCKLLCIDDVHNFRFVSDIVINHTGASKISDYSLSKNTILHSDLKYLLLRKPFLKAARNSNYKVKHNLKAIFICMGGADSKNLTLRILKMLYARSNNYIYHLLTGAAFQNSSELSEFIYKHSDLDAHVYNSLSANKIVDLLKKCDLAICSASTISLEACAVGIPLIVGHHVGNQKELYNMLLKRQMAVGVGEFQTLTRQIVTGKIGELLESKELILRNQRNLIDGNQNLRYLRLFNYLKNTC